MWLRTRLHPRGVDDGVARYRGRHSQLLRVSLGPDVLAVKGSMVAFRGQIRFDHEKAVNGGNLLAFDASMEWDINRTKDAGIMAGGLFNTTVKGRAPSR